MSSTGFILVKIEFMSQTTTIKAEPYKTLLEIKHKSLKILNDSKKNNLHLFYKNKDLISKEHEQIGNIFPKREKVFLTLMGPLNNPNYIKSKNNEIHREIKKFHFNDFFDENENNNNNNIKGICKVQYIRGYIVKAKLKCAFTFPSKEKQKNFVVDDHQEIEDILEKWKKYKPSQIEQLLLFVKNKNLSYENLFNFYDNNNNNIIISENNSNFSEENENSVSSNSNNNNINNNHIISTINVNKEQIEKLKLENAKIKNDLMNLKNKNYTLENENKLLKNENKKLKEENSNNLLIKINDYKNEIEKYKVLNNERINLISEIEEKNKNISDLNIKIENILNNQKEKEKEFNNLKNQINELNKQIDLKDINIDNLNQKNNELLLDKQTIFTEYQKKIEEFQNKFIENENNDDNFSKIIEIVTQNLNELQNIFDKKIENLNSSYEQFKKEYLKRDENIILLLNEKYKFLKNDINNFSNILINKIEKISISNNDDKNANSKLEWYSKQISDLSVFKGKALEYEQKIVSLNKNIQFLNEKIKIAEQNKNTYENMYKLMVEEYKNNQQYQLNIEAKMSEMKNFLFQNLPSEKVEEFNEFLNKK
jgi:hypothetical protein